MAPLQRNTEPERQIPEFELYETDAGWRAVHCREREMIIEHPDWEELFWICVSARMTWELRLILARWEHQRR